MSAAGEAETRRADTARLSAADARSVMHSGYKEAGNEHGTDR
jgi:hypothetical protein